MVFIIILVALVFLCSSFFVQLPQDAPSSHFMVYYLLQQQFVVNYYLFFLGGFVVLIVLFFRVNFDRQFSFIKIFFFSTMQVIAVAIIGFFLSYIFLFFIAFVQLNIFAVLVNNNPATVGIKTERAAIGEILESNRNSPEIIISEQENIVYAVAKATSGTANYYGKYMVSAVPQLFIVPVKRVLPNMLLLDNTLLITKIDQQDIQEVGPSIGYLFVKNYFPARKVKSFPKVSVMDLKAYEEQRKQDAAEKLVKIDAAIVTIEGYISSLSASLNPEEKAGLAPSASSVQAGSIRNRDAEAAKQAQLDEYLYYYEVYKTQRERVAQLSKQVPHELGVFVPEDSIRIVFTSQDSHALGDYFETLVHEYLHYASYISDDRRFANSFFEEGLTEYFARAIIKQQLGLDTNLGYPVQVAIIAEMTNIITASELADLYFTKDEVGLQKALDRVYGDDFYVNNYFLFESLQYASDKKQIIKLANDIMKRIDGKPLTEKDLVSTHSKL